MTYTKEELDAYNLYIAEMQVKADEANRAKIADALDALNDVNADIDSARANGEISADEFRALLDERDYWLTTLERLHWDDEI